MLALLSEEQKKVAIYTNTAPSDIITANRNARAQARRVAMNKMTTLNPVALGLDQEYVRRYRAKSRTRTSRFNR